MLLEDVKKMVEKNQYNGEELIFQYVDTDFVPISYVEKISQDRHLTIQYIHTLTGLPEKSIFESESSTLMVYRTDVLKEAVPRRDNLIIICQKVESDVPVEVCKVPKLEPWQLQDFVYSQLEGVSQSRADHLISLCSNNIYKINNELKKIKLFSATDSLIDSFEADGVFAGTIAYNPYSLIDALVQRDTEKLKEAMRHLDSVSIDPIGFTAMLLKSFDSVISIQLSKNPSPEKLGMSSGQFFAVKKYSCNKYSKQQLMDIYLFLTGIDKRLKTGELYLPRLLDYIILYIVSI